MKSKITIGEMFLTIRLSYSKPGWS